MLLWYSMGQGLFFFGMGKGLCFYCMGEGLSFYGICERNCPFLGGKGLSYYAGMRDCHIKGRGIVILRGEGLSLKRERDCPFMVYGRGTVLF